MFNHQDLVARTKRSRSDSLEDEPYGERSKTVHAGGPRLQHPKCMYIYHYGENPELKVDHSLHP